MIKIIDINGNEYYYRRGAVFEDGNCKRPANVALHEIVPLVSSLARKAWAEHKKFMPKSIYQYQLQEYANTLMMELLTCWNSDVLHELRKEFLVVIGELRKCKMKFWLPYVTSKGEYRLRPCYLHLYEVKND